jgi:lysozyme family protein
LNQQKVNLAINALESKLSDKQVQMKLDTLLRDIYGVPKRPDNETEPFTWLVGKKSEDGAFEEALQFVLRWEGNYVNHPNDKGGATNKGITQRTYDKYRRSKGLEERSVKYITDSEVREIYRTMYWDKAKCNVVAGKSNRLATAHFDWAVNAGVNRAVETMQKCLGTAKDGIWGEKTQAHFNDANADELVTCYVQKREWYYRAWGVGNQRVFLQGWLNRLNDLKDYINE